MGYILTDTSACHAVFGTTSGTARSCGNGVIDIDSPSAPSLGEQCDTSGDTTNPVKDPDTGDDLTCDKVFSFWRVKGGASRASTEPSPKMTGGKVYCRANCMFDLSRCAYDLAVEAKGTTLKDLADKNMAWVRAEVFDKDGKVSGEPSLDDSLKANFGGIGPSDHLLFAFLNRIRRVRPEGTPAGGPDAMPHDIWRITVAMDGYEFGETWGDAHVLNTFEVDFATDSTANLGPVVSVDGKAYDENDSSTWPLISIKGLTRGKSSFNLRLNLGNLDTVRVTDSDGAVAWEWSNWKSAGWVNLYARNGVQEIDGQKFEIPQFGDVRYAWANGGTCDDECQGEARFRELAGFNPQLKRFDTASATYNQLHEAFYDSDKHTTNVQGLRDQANDKILSLWGQLKSTMCNRWGLKFDVPLSANLVRGTPENTCGPDDTCTCPEPHFHTESAKDVAFDENTQIVLVLDRSGSMGTKTESLSDKPVTRLDFVKESGLSLLSDINWEELHRRQVDADGDGNPDSPNAKGPKVGLVWYSDEAEARFPITDEKSCSKDADCNDVTAYEAGVCMDGKCKKTMPRLECNRFPDWPNTSPENAECKNLADVTNELVSQTVVKSAYMKQTSENSNPIPEPGGPSGGFTATGAAIAKAGKLFDPKDSGATRAVVLLTDGFHNRPSGGKCADGSDYRDKEDCWPGENATAAYDQAIKDLPKGTIFFSIPLGVSAERSAQAIRDGQITGEVFQAQEALGQDTIPAFAAVHAALRGQQLARAADTLPVIRADSYLSPAEYEIPVEVGAKALHVTVSSFDAKEDFIPNVVRLSLQSPSGTTYQRIPSNPYHKDDVGELSVRFHIPQPQSGTWKLVDSSWVGTDLGGRHNRYYVTGFVDNPGPNCEAWSDIKTSDGTKPVNLFARAGLDRPIASGATYTAQLQRPDKTIIEIPLDRHGRDPGAHGAVSPSSFVGDGLYVATVSCKVDEGARLVLPENPPRYGREPEPAPTVRTSHAFTRQVHAYFHVRGTGIVPVPGLNGDNQDPGILKTHGLPAGYSPVYPYLGDADGDGIVNSQEPAFPIDSDDDGKPDVNDPDSNGNEIPDGVDSTIPYSPAAQGNGSHCGIWNARTCCTCIGSCIGGLAHVALFAEGDLLVDDSAHVVTGSGAGNPALIVNAGNGKTDVGVAALVGTTRSVASINVRDRGVISGNAVSQGTVTKPDSATISGESISNADLSLPSLSSFSVTIPIGTAGTHLDRGESSTVGAGTYSSLTVKAGATAYLSSGTYYFQALDVEANGVLALDMSSGPIYLYVAHSLIMHSGGIVVLGGATSDLFVAYMGIDAVTLEAPLVGTFVAPSAAITLATLTSGGEFQGTFYARSIEVRPGVLIRALPFQHPWLSPSATPGPAQPPDGGTSDGGSNAFACTGACLGATPIARYTNAANLSATKDTWFVLTDGLTGWQASNVTGRTISVNGVEVAPGQMPLPAPAADGKYYFRFSGGGLAWASWSYW